MQQIVHHDKGFAIAHRAVQLRIIPALPGTESLQDLSVRMFLRHAFRRAVEGVHQGVAGLGFPVPVLSDGADIFLSFVSPPARLLQHLVEPACQLLMGVRAIPFRDAVDGALHAFQEVFAPALLEKGALLRSADQVPDLFIVLAVLPEHRRVDHGQERVVLLQESLPSDVFQSDPAALGQVLPFLSGFHRFGRADKGLSPVAVPLKARRRIPQPTVAVRDRLLFVQTVLRDVIHSTPSFSFGL